MTYRNRLKCRVSAVALDGLGALTVVDAASGGYAKFGADDDGLSFRLLLIEGVRWEVFEGVYTHGTTMLSRGDIEESSADGNARVAFTSRATVAVIFSAAQMTAIQQATGETVLQEGALAPAADLAPNATAVLAALDQKAGASATAESLAAKRDIPTTVAVAASRPLAATDNGKTIECTTAGITLTVPATLPAGFECTIIPTTSVLMASAGGALLDGATTTQTKTGQFRMIARASAANSYFLSSVSAGGGASSFAVGSKTYAIVGDSLSNDTPQGTLGPQEYYTHAVELSKGQIIFGAKFGQGGMGLLTPGNGGKTWAQTLADLSAAYPGGKVPGTDTKVGVSLLIGTNDFGTAPTKSVAEVKAAYIQAIADIKALGFSEIVVSELPPRADTITDSALRMKLHTFNNWVGRYARDQGMRCNHFYSYCADRAGSGDWVTGYRRDAAVHPGPLGARAMGQAFADAVSASYVWKPYLIMDKAYGTTFANGLMLTDVSADGGSAQFAGDGIPDGWGKANTFNANTTYSLVSGGSDVFGNWAQQVRAAAAGNGPIMRSLKIAAVVGDRIQLACVLKSTIAAKGSGPALSLLQAAATAWTSPTIGSLAAPVSQSVAGQQYSINTVVYVEAVVTQATAAGVFVDFQIWPGDAVSANDTGGTFQLGQFTLRNLTQLGIV